MGPTRCRRDTRRRGLTQRTNQRPRFLPGAVSSHLRSRNWPRSNIHVRHYRVSLRDVFQAHAQALKFGGRDGVRSFDLIESAIGRPYSGYYRSIAAKAAALTQSLAKNHGFIDGNKRTALLATILLIHRSGYVLVSRTGGINKEIEQLILDVVEDRLEFDEVVTWFRAHLAR